MTADAFLGESSPEVFPDLTNHRRALGRLAAVNKRRIALAIGTLCLASGLAAAWLGHHGNPSFLPETSAAAAPDAPTLELRELFEPGPGLRPSRKTAAFDGRRVRLVGFMAEMELPPTGAFYLVPRPVQCDEAGGGTADLPPESVLVTVPWMAGKTLPHLPGAVEVTGTLAVGNRSDAEGRVSNFRLRLEGPPGSAVAGQVASSGDQPAVAGFH